MDNNLLLHIITGEANLEEKEEFYSSLGDSKAEEELFYEVKSLWLRSNLLKRNADIDFEFDELWGKIKRPVKNNKIFIAKRILQYAAFLLFILSIGGILGFFISKNNIGNISSLGDVKVQHTLTQEISTVFGTRSKFQLPDGSIVHLNSGSRLVFPIEFCGNSRKVELIGEAFFEVKPDSNKPFIVKAKAINIKVLGTSFNLKAYPESNMISTTLIHGKVVLESESAGIVSQLAELKPSDRAVYMSDNKTIQLSKEEDLDKYIAWKDGKLVFFNDPIDEVAEKLGIWYNVTVKIGNVGLEKYRFTATFTDEPIEQVLDLLSKSSPIKYQIKKAAKHSDKSYSKRQVIFE
jgi:ferric-dicitrate binding protein FerR (iron transport regulator)